MLKNMSDEEIAEYSSITRESCSSVGNVAMRQM